MNLISFEEMKKTTVFFMLKPASAIYGFLVSIFTFISIVIIWAFVAPMEDVVKASSILRTEETVSSVKCISSGQLYSKNYQNDMSVKKGDLLFSLDITMYEVELDSYRKELEKNENDMKINSYLLETMKTEKIPDVERNSESYMKCSGYLLELSRLRSLVNESRIKLAREKSLPDSLRIENNVTDLTNDLRQNTYSFESWVNAQKMNASDEQKRLSGQNSTIKSRIKELERIIQNSTIFAPIDGRIYETKKMNAGDYLFSGEEILKIIPENSESMVAEIYIDPSFIAKIKEGDHIYMKFPGLPPSRYGELETAISFIPPDVTYMNGLPVFIAEAKIVSPYLIPKNGRSAKLIPGITAECRIVTDKSTVMQMVLKKLDFIN